MLTDLNMPEMDGFDAAREIFKYHHLHGSDSEPIIPIVAVTAYDDQGTVDQCCQIGMSSVLNKPVSQCKLDQVI